MPSRDEGIGPLEGWLGRLAELEEVRWKVLCRSGALEVVLGTLNVIVSMALSASAGM